VAQICVLSHPVTMTDGDKNGGPNYLRQWRVFRAMSQSALADAVGTNANMIQYLETGDPRSPDALLAVSYFQAPCPGNRASVRGQCVSAPIIRDEFTYLRIRHRRRLCAACCHWGGYAGE
jgi:hypothetical protein